MSGDPTKKHSASSPSFQQFLIRQQASVEFKRTLAAVASAQRLDGTQNHRPSCRERAFSSEFIQRNSELAAKRLAMRTQSGRRPAAASAMYWQGGSIPTPLHDEAHPNYDEYAVSLHPEP